MLAGVALAGVAGEGGVDEGVAGGDGGVQLCGFGFCECGL